jgi:small subunit ribosomal protein S3
VKVWIFKGEILEHDPSARDRRQQELQEGPAPRGAGGGGRRDRDRDR